MSLGNKIVLLGLFVILVPLCVIGVFSDLGEQRRETDGTFNKLAEVAELQKTRIEEGGMASTILENVASDFHFLGKTGETMVIIRTSDNLLTPFSSPRFSKELHTEFLSQMLASIEQSNASKTYRFRFTDYRGNDVFGAIAPSLNPDIFIVSKIDVSEALKPVDGGRDILLLSSFVSVICIIFFGLMVARSFTDPLLSLSFVVSKFADNPMSGLRSTVTTSDEIGTLSGKFNAMAEKLQTSYQKIENELREREKFKLAVDNSAEQIIITDVNGMVLYANKATEMITGYAREEILGKKVGTLWSSPMPKEYYQNMWRVIKTDKKTFRSQIKNRRKDGEIYDADISISPVLDVTTKEVLFFVGTERDITKEKNIDRAKSEFVSLVSHQLRTPATNMNWFLELLLSGEEGTLNEKQKEYFEEVYHNNQRMVVMINTFLNISRIKLGTFLIKTQPVDISEMVKSALQENEIGIRQKNIIVMEKYPQNPIIVPMDKKLFDIVLQNLISNAVKYTSSDGTLLLEAVMKEKGEKIGGKAMDANSFAIIVSDSGCGIPKNQYDKIFTRFFRADNVKKTDTDGSGLGLYFAKLITEQTGGQIWFESELAKGTVFYVTFPLLGMENKEGEKESLVGSLGNRF
jgi:two-component system sensor histidine kinase VicK